MSRWEVEEWHGDAGTFHALDLPQGRRVWAVTLTSPALVLGSTQSSSEVDVAAAARLGLDVVSRRTGGGAVWLDPTASVWIDVTIPHDDPLWRDDIARSSLWLGEALAGAIVPDPPGEIFTGDFVASPMARALCFAGLAPGEVTVRGRKTVGMSQRRTRDGARFQCVAYTRWEPAAFAGAFRDLDVAQAATSLEVGLIDGAVAELATRLAAALPA
jgi:lipoate-protein ligase A